MSSKFRLLVCMNLLYGLCFIQPCYSLTPGQEDVLVRVIDVGAGLCTVVKMPNKKYMIYDASNKASDYEGIKKLIPEGSEIELLVLSHNDADHIGAVSKICENFKVKRVIRTGYVRTTKVWEKAQRAIAKEVRDNDCIDINLNSFYLPEMTKYKIGRNPTQVSVTFLCGFPRPLPAWSLNSESKKRNAVSIVMKIDYKGNSVLLCGDAGLLPKN